MPIVQRRKPQGGFVPLLFKKLKPAHYCHSSETWDKYRSIRVLQWKVNIKNPKKWRGCWLALQNQDAHKIHSGIRYTSMTSITALLPPFMPTVSTRSTLGRLILKTCPTCHLRCSHNLVLEYHAISQGCRYVFQYCKCIQHSKYFWMVRIPFHFWPIHFGKIIHGSHVASIPTPVVKFVKSPGRWLNL